MGYRETLREFLFVDDMAEASVFLAENYNLKEPINVGTGKEYQLSNLHIN